MKGKINYCPVEVTLKVIGGKWKVLILYYLKEEKVMRFGKLKKLIPGITQKMLTQQLRELEADALIIRKVYAEVPPRVEYMLTKYGESLEPVLNLMCQWGDKHRNQIETGLKRKAV
ncbi:MAG: helix-turn-helix transcriptional regulator [Candidatus Dadabacteria bacterium]|nr:helix-turn-helix transcriptional regulator [Candidatus Dadabacteria bacterium]